MYPLAEEFTSLQGEGVWMGTPMRFVRLAGCNVGTYEGVVETKLWADKEDLKIIYPVGTSEIPRHSVCESATGQRFVCDTEYRMKYRRTITEIIEAAGNVKHVCLTGGEPFLHDLNPLIKQLSIRGIRTHIETSGTREIKLEETNVWVTCAPKRGFKSECSYRIDEWKFVVACDVKPDANIALIEEFLSGFPRRRDAPVFVQPVGRILENDDKNIEHCLKILERRPEWRLSVQMHKFLEVR